VSLAISASRALSYNNRTNKEVNKEGTSGHPSEDAVGRIYNTPNIKENLNVYWNAVNGTMKFTTYGEDDFTFQGSATMKGYYDLTLTGGNPVWNAELQDFDNKVTGEENFRLHETKVFVFRDYIKYLPEWAKKEYFPEYNG
jgi:hypothetical protein